MRDLKIIEVKSEIGAGTRGSSLVIDAFKYLYQCDMIYASNGITEREAGRFFARLMNNQIVCCFEMVVINPTLNKENPMKEYAFDILLGGTNSLL